MKIVSLTCRPKGRWSAAADELELIIDSDFLESEHLAVPPAESGDLPLILDPDFL